VCRSGDSSDSGLDRLSDVTGMRGGLVDDAADPWQRYREELVGDVRFGLASDEPVTVEVGDLAQVACTPRPETRRVTRTARSDHVVA
jgi:hypothetical protein